MRPITIDGVGLSWFQATTATTMTAIRAIAAASSKPAAAGQGVEAEGNGAGADGPDWPPGEPDSGIASTVPFMFGCTTQKK